MRDLASSFCGRKENKVLELNWKKKTQLVWYIFTHNLLTKNSFYSTYLLAVYLSRGGISSIWLDPWDNAPKHKENKFFFSEEFYFSPKKTDLFQLQVVAQQLD